MARQKNRGSSRGNTYLYAMILLLLPCLVRPDPIPSMSFNGPFDGGTVLPGWASHGASLFYMCFYQYTVIFTM